MGKIEGAKNENEFVWSVDEKQRGRVIGEGDETMEKKKQLDKASVHSGKANSQGLAYNANHNTMEEARSNQPHIDQERIRLNTYLQYMGDGSTNRFQGGKGGFDARKHELQRFKELYGEGLEARNERYRKLPVY